MKLSFTLSMKQKHKKTLMSKLVITSISASLLLFTALLLIPNLSISTLAQSDSLMQTNVSKNSIPHNAEGHESHQVVQFVEPNDSTFYKGSITFKSSIPVDIIAYNDTSNMTENKITPDVKTWKIDGKTFVPITIMKNATSGSINFESSGITAHVPYNQSYNVVYSIEAAPANTK